VRDALLIVSDNEGIGISRRRITLSTSGVVPNIVRTGEEIGVMALVRGGRVGRMLMVLCARRHGRCNQKGCGGEASEGEPQTHTHAGSASLGLCPIARPPGGPRDGSKNPV